MNRIQKKFAEIKKRRGKALSVFLTAGCPSLGATQDLVTGLEKAGVDFFEIGFPFSDPFADGATIQKSSEKALHNGVTWQKTLTLCKSIRKVSQVPLIFMSYANVFYVRGWDRSAQELSRAGLDGVIVPDLIPGQDTAAELAFRKHGLDLVYLLAPTSSAERIALVGRKSRGFIYAVSVAGVTGARKSLPEQEVTRFLSRIKKASKLPVVLGFGISEPGQVLRLKKNTDGFVIGSAMMKVVDQPAGQRKLLARAENFIRPFVKALNRGA